MSNSSTEQELVSRITAHITRRNNNDACNLLWEGYLAACLEWGVLTPNEHLRLTELLRNVAPDEIREIFLGVDGQY